MKTCTNISIFLTIVIVLITISCSPPAPPSTKDYIKFRIAGVNINDPDGNHFTQQDPNSPFHSSPNIFEFTLSDRTANPFYPNTFMLKQPLQYNPATKKITLPDLDITTYYNYKVDKKTFGIKQDANDPDTAVFNLYDFYTTRFLDKNGNSESVMLEINSNQPEYHNPNNTKELPLKTGTSNDIALTYNIGGFSSYDIEVVFENNNIVSMTHAYPEMIFNYTADWQEIVSWNNSAAGADTMLNIVVLASGYTQDIADQSLYNSHADMMMNALFTNNFFREHRDKINIFRVNTVSLEYNTKMHDIIGVDGNAPFGDTDRIKQVIRSSFIGSPVRLEDNGNIDVIVILLKSDLILSPPIYNYSLTHGGEIAFRNGQPVNISVLAYNFSGIAHQLGHALARLQDEHIDACNFINDEDEEIGFPGKYDRKYRNVSNAADGLKWDYFINNYYPQASSFRQNYGLGTPEYPAKRRLYNSDITTYYYVPTYKSTMGYEISAQFGPVNFYHMEASFLTRIGAITGEDQDYTKSNSYEWAGYRLSTFSSQYPPSYFMND